MIRVLVVDDSPTMRAVITRALEEDPRLSVVGQAGDPFQARQAIKDFDPDVVTLDIEMPQMNGLDFLERLMRLRPLPVVMVSSLTQRGADATLRALELGAVDSVAKPRLGDNAGFDRLADIVCVAASARVRPARKASPTPPPRSFEPANMVVAIGSSTGGVEALLAILANFPANCPPTVIAQHMPATFTGSFANRLDRSCAAAVCEATDGAPLLPGQIYLAPGGLTHLEVTGSSAGPWRCRLSHGGPVNGHRPSVDVLFGSVAASAGARSVGVILTGMGTDGAQGLLAMRRAGSTTIGQDEASSVVYGMPKAAYELGAVQTQVPLQQVATALLTASHAGGRACRALQVSGS